MELGAEEWILRGIREGFDLPMAGITKERAFKRANSRSADLEERFVSDEIDSLVQLGVLAPTSSSTASAVLSMQVVRNSSGLRLVVDGSPLSDLMPPPPKFSYEGWSEVAEGLSKGDYMTKFDVRRLYYHIPIARRWRQWLCVQWKGATYHFRALPMGLSWSPWIATQVMAVLVRFLRSHGVQLAQYLDDGLVWARTPQLARRHARAYKLTLLALGLQPHPSKCVLRPTRRIDFLGFHLDSAALGNTAPLISMLPKKRLALCAKARLISRSPRLLLRPLASFVGGVVSLMRAFLPGIPLLRSTMKLVAESAARLGWRASVPISEDVAGEAKAIRKLLASDLWTSQPLRPPRVPDLVLTTDASDAMWGAFLSLPENPDIPLEPGPVQGLFPAVVEPPLATRLSTLLSAVCPEALRAQELSRAAAVLDVHWAHQPTPLRHNNLLEGMGVMQAIMRFAPRLKGRRLVLRSDNITVIAAVRRGFCRSKPLCRLALCVRLALSWLDCQLVSVTHLPGHLNTLADTASRVFSPEYARLEWPCDSRVLLSVLRSHSLTMPEVDAFATAANSKCRSFWSLFPEADSAGVDAFAQVWRGRSLFLNPPFSLAAKVVERLAEDPPGYALVMLPDWPVHIWHQKLSARCPQSFLLPPEVVMSGPLTHLPEPLTNPSWRIRLWVFGSPSRCRTRLTPPSDLPTLLF
jgi:hypothetical protein